MIGKVLIGVTVTGSAGSKRFRRVMHSSRGLPFTSALHEPQRPALRFQRRAKTEGSARSPLSLLLEELAQVLGHLRQRLPPQAELAVLDAQRDVEPAQLWVG